MSKVSENFGFPRTMRSKNRILLVLSILMAITLLPRSGAYAEQTRSFAGGTLYDLQCNGDHDLQLTTVNASTGVVTNIGQPTLGTTTGINTCINSLAYDAGTNNGTGYVLAYATYEPHFKIHTLNFETGALSEGTSVNLDSTPNTASAPMGFSVDPRTHTYYILYTRWSTETGHDGIHVAKINPLTGVVTDRQFVANEASVLATSAAAGYVLSGFAYNPADSKFYIATGNSDGGNRDNGVYHLFTLNPNTGALVDVASTPSPEALNSENISAHSFFTMTFDHQGTIWGVTNSNPRGRIATQSATVSGWATPGNLILSATTEKQFADGEDDQVVYVPFEADTTPAPSSSSEPSTPDSSSSLQRAVDAKAAEAKHEAEVRTARVELTNQLTNPQALTAETFKQAAIAGVTKENFADVQAEISALPADQRSDISQVLKIARKYEVVGNIASEQVRNIPASSLIEIGLIPADFKYKTAILKTIQSLDPSQRDSFAEIKAAIDAETARIQVRKDRLSKVLARHSNR